MNAMDPFEQRLKEALKDFEVPYNSADWSQLERNLDDRVTSGRWSSAGLYALLIIGALGLASLFILLDRDPESIVEVSATPGSAPQPSASPMVDSTTVNPIITTPQQDSGSEAEHDSHVVAEASPVAPRVPDPHAQMATTSDRSVTSPQHDVAPARSNTVAATPKPGSNELGFKASISEGCPGTNIQFAAENVPENGIYLWNFGDGSFSNKAAPSHTFSKAGKYEVMLSVSNTAGGNIRNKPASDLIVIHEAPQASFTTMKQEYEGHIPSVHFENRSQGGASFQWDFGDGNQSTVAHPDHIYKRKGTYQVVLTVTNERGCVDKREREVRIDRDYNLDAPASFSPNGDGSDDLFMPEALKTLQPRFVMTIHEARTGRKVYETRDATKPWNGRLDNRSEPCPTGEYIWMAEIKEGAHLGDVVFDGKVSLVR